MRAREADPHRGASGAQRAPKPMAPTTREATSATQLIEALQAEGRYTFSTEEASRTLGVAPPAARAALRRLAAKGAIAQPYRGFHVVLPPQYRRLGCLPAEQFVPDLMAHLGIAYYVGLLSAAAYYGAAHQAPQVYQVMVAHSRRDLECGQVRVDFIARRDMDMTPVVARNTPTGVVQIATREATALELVGHPEHCGYLDNVATVLAELLEDDSRSAPFDAALLAAEARRAPRAWVQRLGYLLTLVGAEDVATSLDPVLAERGLAPVKLAPWRDAAEASRDRRWGVIVNTDIDLDR